MQSMSHMEGGGANTVMQANSVLVQKGGAQQRSVDIQIVGASGVGKTCMLEGLIKEHDPAQLSKFQQDRANIMGRYR